MTRTDAMTTLTKNDRALLLALLARELENGPLHPGRPEKHYLAKVTQLVVKLR